MMMWIYAIPVWLLAVLIVAVFVAFALFGLRYGRRWLHRWLGLNAEANTPVGYFSSGLYVFFGLLVGLVAVAAWQDYQDVQVQVAQETATLNALYRDISLMPDPLRDELHNILRTYIRYVIEHEWPAQQQSQWVTGGTLLLDDFQARLVTYQPPDTSHQALFARTLEQFDRMVEFRRLRAGAVDQGLPWPLWAVVLVGAVLCIWITYFFYVEDWRVHTIMVILLTTFIALTIFLTAAMDHPFQGEFSVPVENFQMLLERMQEPTRQ
jgi:hypothetical protein